MDQNDILIYGLKNKDVLAFEKIHQMYAKNICGAINLIVNDETLAEEICQDVFLTIWEKAQNYEPSKGRFFTWLLNIARHKAIDYTRSKKYKENKMNHSLDLFVNILEKQDDEKPQKDYSGLALLIKQLKKKCVELISAIYFKGYSQTEAAEELSIPLGTVKSRNRNCLNEIRKNLKHEL